jgi:hypothetical protein
LAAASAARATLSRSDRLPESESTSAAESVRPTEKIHGEQETDRPPAEHCVGSLL